MNSLFIFNYFLEQLKTPSNVFSFSKIEKLTDQKTCIICYDEFCNDSTIYELVCNHIFHKKCILEWSRYSRLCPICKEEL